MRVIKGIPLGGDVVGHVDFGEREAGLETRAEALFTAARKRHDDEIRADEREKILAKLDELLARNGEGIISAFSDWWDSEPHYVRHVLHKPASDTVEEAWVAALTALAAELRGKS